MAVSSQFINASIFLSTESTPTNESSVDGTQFEEPLASKILYSVIFALTLLASLVGNTVVCKAACEFPSKKPLSYHLVTNLAVAEIIGTFCLPFMFSYQYLGHWPFGEVACKLVIPLQVMCMFVVTSTLAAIAVYRLVFIAVQPSVKTTTSRTGKIVSLGLLWVVALVIALPLFVFHKEEPGDEKGMYCNVEYVAVYEVTKFILNFGVPYLTMVVSYGAVAFKIKKHISQRRRQEAATDLFEFGPRTEQDNVEKPIQHQDTTITLEIKRQKNSRIITDLENDLLKMIYALILIFVVCYLPYQVHFLFIFLNGYEEYPEAQKYMGLISRYLFLLTSFPSALHPLCYGTMSKFYARIFARLVLCRRSRV